ncbi:glucose dehydrogenase-like [Sarcoptes scabiei]|nr:glucose dehydrogenase-like [Sarcoptes scabiei]
MLATANNTQPEQLQSRQISAPISSSSLPINYHPQHQHQNQNQHQHHQSPLNYNHQESVTIHFDTLNGTATRSLMPMMNQNESSDTLSTIERFDPNYCSGIIETTKSIHSGSLQSFNDQTMIFETFDSKQTVPSPSRSSPTSISSSSILPQSNNSILSEHPYSDQFETKNENNTTIYELQNVPTQKSINNQQQMDFIPYAFSMWRMQQLDSIQSVPESVHQVPLFLIHN